MFTLRKETIPHEFLNEHIVENVPTRLSDGTFVVLANSVKDYLEMEYKRNRIDGNQYTQLLMALLQAAMQSAITYELERGRADDNFTLAIEGMHQDWLKHKAQLELEKQKHEDMMEIQREKLKLEKEMNEAQKYLIEAQARAFAARHRKDLAKLLFDVVTVGVSQEQMDILAGPNSVFEGLSPKKVFEDAKWENN